ncbi:extracellular aldonolactonase, partial [Geopyxis carbonaria]
TLVQTSTHTGCTADPSWLTFDAPNRLLYCLDDDPTNNGSVSSYHAASDGVLSLITRIDTPPGPVSGVLYGRSSPDEDAGLLVANYHSTSAITLLTTPAGGLTRGQTFTFSSPAGPNPRQEKPHPHQALLSPSGTHLIVPDLGSDVLRVFSRSGLTLTEQTPVAMAKGSGPRHAAFWTSPEGVVFLYVLAELANTVTAYRVDLEAGVFTPVFNTTSLGGPVPRAGTMAAEILVSPDANFITVSNRRDASSTLPSGAASDTLVTFAPQPDGALVFVQAAAAGGGGPRHFAFNRVGDRVAVGLQTEGEVVVLERDVETGRIGGVVARVGVGVGPACVVWDE